MKIAGVVTQSYAVTEDTSDGDTIDAGQGNNIVFGDNGRVTAATDVDETGTDRNTVNFVGLPITLGLVETIESLND